MGNALRLPDEHDDPCELNITRHPLVKKSVPPLPSPSPLDGFEAGIAEEASRGMPMLLELLRETSSFMLRQLRADKRNTWKIPA